MTDRIRDLFLGHSFLLPTPTNYLLKLGPLVLVLVATAFVLAFRRRARSGNPIHPFAYTFPEAKGPTRHAL